MTNRMRIVMLAVEGDAAAVSKALLPLRRCSASGYSAAAAPRSKAHCTTCGQRIRVTVRGLIPSHFAPRT
jgi:hypothetical protein